MASNWSFGFGLNFTSITGAGQGTVVVWPLATSISWTAPVSPLGPVSVPTPSHLPSIEKCMLNTGPLATSRRLIWAPVSGETM